MQVSEVKKLKVGDKIKYKNPEPELGICNFGIGTVKYLSINTDHVFVETDNPLLRGWYHDYNLEVVNESQGTD
jgi:hypothetical protein